jgi:predicted TIM-barrel fold metal-dependent hydrolase
MNLMSTKFISTNEHVIESPDVWTSRLSKEKWGDRIPHIARRGDGTEVWLIDEREVPLVGAGSAAACMPERSEEPQRWDDIPGVITDPSKRAAAMEEQGISHAVLYPSVAGIGGEGFGAIEDPDLELACVQAYNDWLLEEWSRASSKFIAQCIVPLSSFAAMEAEIRRSVAKGHRGVIFPGIPDQVRKGAPHINDPGYDAVWRTCEELGVPICFQAGIIPSMELEPYSGYPAAVAAAFRAITRPASGTAMLSNFLVSKIFERFPNLQVVFAESAMGLTSFSVEGSDYGFRMWRLDERYGHKARPSAFFRKNCHIVGWYDHANLREVADYLGTDSLLWTTKFPLGTSPWPDVQKQIDASFDGMSSGEREKILWSNPAALYKLT